jgi:hypothetical protein
MARYPLYFSIKQQALVLDLMDSIRHIVKSEGQGTSSVLHILYTNLKEINPGVSAVSCNYYDCDGRKAFAIKIESVYSDLIDFGGRCYKGFVFGAPNGHLSRYYKLRW